MKTGEKIDIVIISSTVERAIEAEEAYRYAYRQGTKVLVQASLLNEVHLGR